MSNFTTAAKTKGSRYQGKSEKKFNLVVKFLDGFDSGAKPQGWKPEDGNPLRSFKCDNLNRCYYLVRLWANKVDLAMIYDLQKGGNPLVAKYNISNQWNNAI
jgi:hypothetical protein